MGQLLHLLFLGQPNLTLFSLQRGGWVLLLGVDHSSDSTIHIGEDYGGESPRR
jgi:aminoglycoside N3'-acetyltransferase